MKFAPEVILKVPIAIILPSVVLGTLVPDELEGGGLLAYATYQAAASMYEVCSSCNGSKTKGALLCRKCKHDKKAAERTCVDCGTAVIGMATRCMSCYLRMHSEKAYQPPICMDCGQQTKSRSQSDVPKRCWPCSIAEKRRKSLYERAECSIEGCLRQVQAKHLCRQHYQQTIRKPRLGTHRSGSFSRLIAFWPCQVCGYDRLHSHVHRVVHGAQGGQYLPGNIVAVCARCHEEIHRGITPPPVPPTAEEILAKAN
jgi:hypothetical protein